MGLLSTAVGSWPLALDDEGSESASDSDEELEPSDEGCEESESSIEVSEPESDVDSGESLALSLAAGWLRALPLRA